MTETNVNELLEDLLDGKIRYIMFIWTFFITYACSGRGTVFIFTSARRNYSCADAALQSCSANCSQWIYDTTVFKSTLQSKYQLACGRDEYVAAMGPTLFWCGITIGSILYGPLSDRFGRNKMLSICLIKITILGILKRFAPTAEINLAVSFFEGFVNSGIPNSGLAYVNEMMNSKHRSMMPALNLLANTLCVLVLVLVSYIWRDTDTVYDALILSSGICVLPSLLLPESIRWLLVKKRYKDAETAIKQIKRINGDNNMEDFSHYFKENTNSDEKPKDNENDNSNSVSQLLWRVLKAKSLLRSGFIMICFIISSNLCHYSVIYGVENLPGSLHLNAVLLVLPAFLSMILNFGGSYCIGRRCMTCTSGIIAGTFCLLIGFTINVDRWLAIAVGITCVIFGELALSMTFLYPSEVYPTEIRNSGTGLSTALGRVGAMLAPQLKWRLKSSPPIILYAVVSMPVIMSAILAILLPETSNQKLPETIEEADQRNQFKNHNLYQRFEACIADEYRRVYYEPTSLTPYEKLK